MTRLKTCSETLSFRPMPEMELLRGVAYALCGCTKQRDQSRLVMLWAYNSRIGSGASICCPISEGFIICSVPLAGIQVEV
jgi:hypothetical protein